MTLTLSIDFETTGLFRKDLPLIDSSQPHIVQVGAVLSDEDGYEGSSMESIVKPTDWTIEDAAVKVHGITTQKARKVGLPIASVLRQLMPMVTEADLIIAHNLQFDRRMIEAELARLKADGGWWRNAKKLCTMETATPVLKLPNSRFDGEFKWPKLSEAHILLLPEVTWEAKHAALDDARAAMRIYRALQRIANDHAGAATG